VNIKKICQTPSENPSEACEPSPGRLRDGLRGLEINGDGENSHAVDGDGVSYWVHIRNAHH